jgi:hypothetical protein
MSTTKPHNLGAPPPAAAVAKTMKAVVQNHYGPEALAVGGSWSVSVQRCSVASRPSTRRV